MRSGVSDIELFESPGIHDSSCSASVKCDQWLVDDQYLWIQERVSAKDFSLTKVVGTANPADMLTKALDKTTWLKYSSRMYNVDLSKVPAASESVRSPKGGV